MVINLYSCVDKLASKPVCCFMSASDGMAVRENAPALSRVLPLGDLQLLHVGTIDDSTFEVKSCVPRVVDWNCYKFPESPIIKEDLKK